MKIQHILAAVGGLCLAACGGLEKPEPSGSDSLASLVTSSASITQAGDELRTGWYPDQPALDPATVGGPTFGRRFRVALPLSPGEQVFAQPLVNGSSVFVATEANNLYVLDAETGAISASRALGTPFNPQDVACGDLTPKVGVTGTPVIDTTTNTAYLFSKGYNAGAAIWYFHAVDATTLVERTGFPVIVQGAADNDASITFDPKYEMQRPGLLLLNGVVYGAFGAHCDQGTYHGWVVGISTAGQITARFATEAGPSNVRGAGIWQSGAGLVSDGAGRIFFATGNGYAAAPPNPLSGSQPNALLDESFVRLQVGAAGKLSATSFFAPYDVQYLNDADLDFGSGGPVGLPDQYFGTAAYPKLAVIAGKKGVLYTVDRDNLGGYQMGASRGDLVVSSVNVDGGLWSRPAVWPGDGKYLYLQSNQRQMQALKYSVTAQGAPSFTITGRTSGTFGYTSGSPIVTSNGTAPGSALVWVTYTTGSYGTGELRAYDAVPVNGTLNLRYADAYGVHAKFTTPGVGAGRIYVGTADGYVVAYGAPKTTAISGPTVDFGNVVVNASSTAQVVLTATQPITVSALSTSDAAFSLGTPSAALPVLLNAGGTLSVPVTFKPTKAAGYAATLNISTSVGTSTSTLRGTGQANGPALAVAPGSLSFGGITTGSSKSLSIVLTNAGNQLLTFSASTPPAPPFSANAAPLSGQTLAPGSSLSVPVTFAPTADGSYASNLDVASDGGNLSVFVSGAAGAPPVMVITPLSSSFGDVPVGNRRSLSFSVANQGASDLTITKSKPPTQGLFVAQTALQEGTIIPAGQQLIETVTFAPAATGSFSDLWIITGNDSSGVQNVTFNGTSGKSVVLSRAGWTASASASAAGDAAANALDGNPTTRFSTGAAQTSGQWFQVDMGKARPFSWLTLDNTGSPGDHASGYQLFVSSDGINWGPPVASGNPTSDVFTIFPGDQNARYFRIVQTGFNPNNWWSIHELTVGGALAAAYKAGSTVQAEAYTTQVGTQLENNGTTVGYFDAGDSLCYDGVDLSGVTALSATIAGANSGGVFTVRLDSPTGTQLATYTMQATGGWTAWKSVVIPIGAATGIHTLCLKAELGTGGCNFDSFSLSSSASSPYGGTARSITSIIEAEDFDVGGEGISYHDAEAQNQGGAYRANDGADIQATTDVFGAFNVGWTRPGEWMSYSLTAATGGAYRVNLRVAATAAGQTLHLSLDGVDITGPLTVPNTGGWQTWQTISAPLTTTLSPGPHLLRVTFDTIAATSGGINLNWLTFTP